MTVGGSASRRLSQLKRGLPRAIRPLSSSPVQIAPRHFDLSYSVPAPPFSSACQTNGPVQLVATLQGSLSRFVGLRSLSPLTASAILGG